MFKSLIGLFSNDMAIDLGTANTLVCVKDRGIIINEPSVVAIDRSNNSLNYIIGKEAKEMIGKAPDFIEIIKPLKDGVISNYDMAKKMIRYFIEKTHKRTMLISPRVIICVPYGLTEVEKNAIIQSAKEVGAREVYLIEEPIAAAIGAKISIEESKGNLVVDIGGGTCEIGVISLGGLVVSKSIKVGGDKIDFAIINYIKKKYGLVIGEFMAEEIKIKLGSAKEFEKIQHYKIQGKIYSNQNFIEIEISNEDIRIAMADNLKKILNAIKNVLEHAPVDIAGDIIDNGILLTGGGALIQGLDEYLSQKLKLPVHIAHEPLLSVAKGTAMSLENLDLLKRLEVH